VLRRSLILCSNQSTDFGGDVAEVVLFWSDSSSSLQTLIYTTNILSKLNGHYRHSSAFSKESVLLLAAAKRKEKDSRTTSRSLWHGYLSLLSRAIVLYAFKVTIVVIVYSCKLHAIVMILAHQVLSTVNCSRRICLQSFIILLALFDRQVVHRAYKL
jgi:hypothetical protein